VGGNICATQESNVVSKIALGTVQFGVDYGVANKLGKVSLSEAKKIISFAKKYEVNTIDTANAYGDSETVLGGIGVEDFNIVTKLSFPLNVDKFDDWLKSQIEETCVRLRVDTLYSVLIHNPSVLLGKDGLAISKALKKIKDDGKVRKIGVSVYDPEELVLIAPVLNVDIVQAPLNVIDRRIISTGWLKRLKDSGVEIHTRSAFLQGLLLMNRQDIPEKFERWSKIWNKWHHFLRDQKVTPLSACLSYPLSLKEVDRVVVGVDSAKQLSDIVEDTQNAEPKVDTAFMTSTDIKLINPSLWNTF
jgi:hypothetical protein